MATLNLDEQTHYLAMRYVENTGYDIKLYVTGQEVHAVMKSSPLHERVSEVEIPVTNEMLKLARKVGKVFGLDLYGVDVLESNEGLIVVDINDFPGFHGVPRKVAAIAEYILHAAYRCKREREKRPQHSSVARRLLRRQDTRLVPAELFQERLRGNHSLVRQML
jgi:ribosomal protein S6--L-glutamate ligase